MEKMEKQTGKVTMREWLKELEREFPVYQARTIREKSDAASIFLDEMEQGWQALEMGEEFQGMMPDGLELKHLRNLKQELYWEARNCQQEVFTRISIMYLPLLFTLQDFQKELKKEPGYAPEKEGIDWRMTRFKLMAGMVAARILASLGRELLTMPKRLRSERAAIRAGQQLPATIPLPE